MLESDNRCTVTRCITALCLSSSTNGERLGSIGRLPADGGVEPTGAGDWRDRIADRTCDRTVSTGRNRARLKEHINHMS